MLNDSQEEHQNILQSLFSCIPSPFPQARAVTSLHQVEEGDACALLCPCPCCDGTLRAQHTPPQPWHTAELPPAPSLTLGVSRQTAAVLESPSSHRVLGIPSLILLGGLGLELQAQNG